MGHTKWLLPVQNDPNERQPNVDPRASLLKVAIEGIELQQIEPTFHLRSLPPGLRDLYVWGMAMFGLQWPSLLGPASEIAVLDIWALISVRWGVEKNDNLHEVFVRAVRSILEGIRHASNCQIVDRFLVGLLKRMFHGTAASESDSELPVAYTLHAFLASVLHLLTSVFQYLIGYVDRGGSKTYSSGAFDFRASFVALVLFQGAYVWIKFRQAARPGCRKRKAPDVEHEVVDIETGNLKGVYARPIKEKTSGAITRFKYEPRFTPPRQEGGDGTDPCSKRLPLGEYHTRAEAQIVRQIARYYYGKDGGCVELEDGRYKFPIPPMREQERGLAGKEKRKWVTRTAKQVGKQMHADFQREKGTHLDITATEAGSHGAESNDPSSSALPLACTSPPMLTTMAAEPANASAAPSPPSQPLLALDGATAVVANVFSEDPSVIEDMLDVLFCDLGLPNLPDQQSSVVPYQMQYQGFAQFPGDPSLPEVGSVPGAIEHDLELELNPSPTFQEGMGFAGASTENIDGRVFLQQNDPVLQQFQFCQECLENNARHFIHLDQRKAYEIQISRLQQENERLKSRLQQVASLSCNLDWSHDGHSTEGLNDFGFLEK